MLVEHIFLLDVVENLFELIDTIYIIIFIQTLINKIAVI